MKLIKISAAILLGLGIVLCLLLKSVIWFGFHNPQIQETIKGSLDYTAPATIPDKAFIFDGMVVQIPKNAIDDISGFAYAQNNQNFFSFFFSVEPKSMLHISRMPNYLDRTPKSGLGRIKNSLIGLELKTQYEADDKTWTAESIFFLVETSVMAITPQLLIPHSYFAFQPTAP